MSLEYNSTEYVVLLPVDDDIEDIDGQVVILEIEETENNDGESYIPVSDDETLIKVFEIFKDKFKDEFNFTD